MAVASVHSIAFHQLIKVEQWQVYDPLLDLLANQGAPFALGGAFALAVYTGRLRDTKDLDLYVLPEHSERFKRATAESGLEDYFTVSAYDRSWIYRSYFADTIVDIIWAFANHVSAVDFTWFERAPTANFGRHRVKVIPPEELLRAKLYVLQRARCDWPDLLNLLFCCGDELDWEILLEKVGDDASLFAGLMSVFAWLAPGRAADLPQDAWARVGLRAPTAAAEPVNTRRVNLLESRPWFWGSTEK